MSISTARSESFVEHVLELDEPYAVRVEEM